jgi:ABC-type glycerol-3-phosphate transport system substrate-binding protein
MDVTHHTRQAAGVSLRSLLVAAVAATLVLAGCGGEDWSEPHAKLAAVGTVGPGFIDAEHPPAPEATITPTPGSWDGVHPAKGYRVALLTAGEDAATKTLVETVNRWAQDEDVSFKTVTAGTNPKHYVDKIVEAMRLKPDLIIVAGNALADPVALVSANHLDQQFLVLGAEVPEPTENVTAANWPGAGFRGNGLVMRDSYDPKTFTPERADAALRAGVAAVLNGHTGYVVRVNPATPRT